MPYTSVFAISGCTSVDPSSFCTNSSCSPVVERIGDRLGSRGSGQNSSARLPARMSGRTCDAAGHIVCIGTYVSPNFQESVPPEVL